jgi:hypothetical protein
MFGIKHVLLDRDLKFQNHSCGSKRIIHNTLKLTDTVICLIRTCISTCDFIALGIKLIPFRQLQLAPTNCSLIRPNILMCLDVLVNREAHGHHVYSSTKLDSTFGKIQKNAPLDMSHNEFLLNMRHMFPSLTTVFLHLSN